MGVSGEKDKMWWLVVKGGESGWIGGEGVEVDSGEGWDGGGLVGGSGRVVAGCGRIYIGVSVVGRTVGENNWLRMKNYYDLMSLIDSWYIH